MHHKKRLPNGTLWHYAAFLGIMTGAIFFNGKALANFELPPGVAAHSCLLYVSSIDYPTGPTNIGSTNPYGPCIFDDFSWNVTGGGVPGGWNCGRQFTIAEYTSVADTFTFAYDGYYSTDSLPVHSHDIKLWFNGTGTRHLVTHLTQNSLLLSRDFMYRCG